LSIRGGSTPVPDVRDLRKAKNPMIPVRKNRLVRLSLLVLVPLLVLAATWLPVGRPEDKIIVSIESGSGTSRIARDLKKAGVIRNAVLFKLGAVLSGRHAQLKAGDYSIPGGLDQWQVLDLLVSGRTLLQKFLVPEGLSSRQMAGLLEEKKLADAQHFLSLVNNTAFAQSLSITAASLEGYLFPDSYQFSRGIPGERIVEMMVHRFQQKVPVDLLKAGSKKGLNPHQLLTMASIIEKECAKDDERAKVASVFYNRLAQNQRLESCATVRFAMNKFSGPILFEDLQFKSKYNTYRHRGLPPGPICSPGLESIVAAAHPADTRYLFFVVAGNGEHIFSETFEQHKKAKLRYKRLVRQGVVEE
jgi:UPF0755 protein